MDHRHKINLLIENRLVRHTGFWLSYILIMTYIHSVGTMGGEFFSWFMNYLIELPLLLGLTYSVTYFIIPRFFLKNKFIIAALLILAVLYIFSFLNVVLDNLLIRPLFFSEKPVKDIPLPGTVTENAFGLLFPVVIFISFSFGIFDLKKSRRQNLEERNIAHRRLEDIRNKIHPLFLRDALDEVYIVSRNSPSLVPEMILKISDILQYFLYDCSSDKVSLRKEEQTLRNYLGFLKICHGSNFSYDILINGNIQNVVIAPYILLSLTRAVYRYSTFSENVNVKIFLTLELEDGKLNFIVSRKSIPEDYPGGYDFDWKEDIATARKRLETGYPWKHELDVLETGSSLKINLKIEFD